MRSSVLAAVLVVTSLAAVAPPGLARADQPEGEEEADLTALEKRLRTGTEAERIAALEQLGAMKDERAVPLVDGVLARGGSVKVLLAALAAAAKLGHESSSAVAAPYLRHRSAELRHAAVTALIRTGGAAAGTALREALRSRDPAVRAAAAAGLGDLGVRDALPDLFRALDRGIAGAAVSIGRLCDPERCLKLAERLGAAPIETVTRGLDPILFRPVSEVPDETKIAIIERVRGLHTPEGRAFLADVARRWPEDGSDAVRRALAGPKEAPKGSR